MTFSLIWDVTSLCAAIPSLSRRLPADVLGIVVRSRAGMGSVVTDLRPARAFKLNDRSRCLVELGERNIGGIAHSCILKCCSARGVKISNPVRILDAFSGLRVPPIIGEFFPMEYWFDWMAGFHEPTLRKSFLYSISTPGGGFEEAYEQQMERRRSMLYATRVQDRFGNWVTYRYSNAADQPVRLEAIESSDGRSITLSYNAAGRIASASAGGRTWTYAYTADAQSLANVTLPDGTAWAYDFTNYVRGMPVSGADVSSCSYPGVIVNGAAYTNGGSTLYVIHPSGARGQFELRPKLHGRSNVPYQCVPVAGSDNPEVGADYSDYVRFYWANSLVGKKISGPGMADLQWSYAYNASQTPAQASSFLTHPASYSPPGSWAARPYTYTRLADEGKPITDISTYIITDPVCVSDACAGTVSTDVTGPDSWERYTYGNSYRYNERKLLRRDSGTSNGTIQRTETYTYELSRANLPYEAVIGATRQYQGDGLTEAALRPVKSETIQQDGRKYSRTIDGYDSLARPTQWTESSSSLP